LSNSITTLGRHSLREQYYFYCRIRPERLLYDNESDLLAIAKFLVITCGHNNSHM